MSKPVKTHSKWWGVLGVSFFLILILILFPTWFYNACSHHHNPVEVFICEEYSDVYDLGRELIRLWYNITETIKNVI